jgi:hypothetical protein
MAVENRWLIGKAAVQGVSHLAAGVPCQDYCEVETSPDGRWLVAAISDGAGSAAKAAEGAQIVAQSIVRGLIGEVARLERDGPGLWLKDRVYSILLDTRERLRRTGDDIRDYHCTLVGTFIGPTGGILFHVGDGAAIASRIKLVARAQAQVQELQLWNDVVFSEPENGEYANETFFITQDDWIKHLRGNILSPGVDIVALMTDGAMPFAIQQGQPNAPFMDPLIGQMLRAGDAAERDAILQKYLSLPKANEVTNDDKTLMIAIRRDMADFEQFKIIPSTTVMLMNSLADMAKPKDPNSFETTEEPQPLPKVTLLISLLALAIAIAALTLSGLALYQGRLHKPVPISMQPSNNDAAPRPPGDNPRIDGGTDAPSNSPK